MPTHKSAAKRVRQNQKKRLHNKYYAKTMRNAVKNLRATTDKSQAEESFSKVVSMIDKLAKKNIIHKNKASNLKSKLKRHVNSLS